MRLTGIDEKYSLDKFHPQTFLLLIPVAQIHQIHQIAPPTTMSQRISDPPPPPALTHHTPSWAADL